MVAKMTDAEFHERYSPEPNTGCWVWTGPVAPNGYGTHGTDKAHRVSYRIHNGPIPSGMWVLHSCDNRWCVSPHHLRLGTRRENIDDMVARRRNRVSKQQGQKNPAAKLTPEGVVQIRARLARGDKHGAIAKDFGVGRFAIWRIAAGTGWTSVEVLP